MRYNIEIVEVLIFQIADYMEQVEWQELCTVDFKISQ